MRTPNPVLRCVLAAIVFTQSLTPSIVNADHFFGRIKERLISECKYKGTEPATCQDCAIEGLAENIDWLEHHIDTYGSVVAKQPDIWGEARLTKHRDEYERIMFRELNQFKSTINAAISQSDSSFLAQALALSNAAGTGVNTDPADMGENNVAVANAQLRGVDDVSTSFNRFGIADTTTPTAPGLAIEPVVALDQMSRYLQHLHELRRINEGDDTSDSPGYSMNLVRMPISILPGKLTREGFGAEVTVTVEPVISDDLMPTTFRNLAINDVVDLLGLPLVRVTESLEDIEEALKAMKSEGVLRSSIHQIESAFDLHKGDDNAEAFSKKTIGPVKNILQDQLAVKALLEAFTIWENKGVGSEISASQKRSITTMPRNTVQRAVRNAYEVASTELLDSMRSSKTRTFSHTVEVQSERADGSVETLREEKTVAISTEQALKDLTKAIRDNDAPRVATQVFYLRKLEPASVAGFSDFADTALTALAVKAASIASITPSGRTRRALNPLNPSSLGKVIGIENLAVVARFFRPAYYGKYIRWNGGIECEGTDKRVDLLDARRFLQAEIEAAYELLSEPEHVPLFAALAASNSKLASQIRSGHFGEDSFDAPQVEKYRHYFFNKLHEHTTSMVGPGGPRIESQHCDPLNASTLLNEIRLTKTGKASSNVEALAWAIIVESALLNERLNRDVRKLAKAKEAFDLDTQRDYWFFLPDSVTTLGRGLEPLQDEFQQATEVFKRYVQVRWPIHVFAIDPKEQDQNVADVSQRKRELQFALALGFSTGQIGGNSLTQFSRELETQVETISLNRTIVGFGHGADTFGWRFYPRVQSLDVPGTFGAIRETLCGTSRDYDLRHRQLEAGQRECVAVVLMPSFVPYADFDIRTNWFKLTNPKNAALTMKESVRLSRAVTAMRNSRSQCAQCQHLYRDGELRRLQKRVDQLDRELPLQTQRALVPYENTLGGFEMFNTGVTDLSPELIGWYGAPGINVTEEFNCGCFKACGGSCSTAEQCKALQATVANLSTRVDSLVASRASATDPAEPLPECEGPGTTLFLVGDNFSVHDTKVIAGGVCIPHFQLISREIMRVTIPSCVNQVTLCENDRNNQYVAVYVATPYGVTNHLHVPVIPQEVAQETKDQVKVEVKTQVESELKKYRLPDRAISVALADGDRKMLTLDADDPCDSSKQTLYTLKEANRIQVKYRRDDDPRFAGKKVTFSAVFKFEGFLGPLVEVARFDPLISEQNFFATGPREGDALDASTIDFIGAEVSLLQQLIKLDCKQLQSKDNKIQLQLQFYAAIEGQAIAIPLFEPLDVMVDFPKPKQVATGAGAEAAPTPMMVPQQGDSNDGSGTREPANQSTEELPPLKIQSDCNCGGNDPVALRVIPITNFTATRNRRVPARFAMQVTSVPAEELTPDLTELTELKNRLNEFESTLMQTAQNQVELQSTLTTQAQVLQAKNSEITPSQSIVNVRVTSHPVPANSDKKWWDNKNIQLLIN